MAVRGSELAFAEPEVLRKRLAFPGIKTSLTSVKQVGIYELKTRVSSLIAEVEATGEPIALTKHGRVVAEITPPQAVSPKAGMLKSAGFFVAEDFDADSSAFDDLLTDQAGGLPPRLQKVAEEPAVYRVKSKKA